MLCTSTPRLTESLNELVIMCNTADSIARLRTQSWSRSFHLGNIYLNTNQITTMIYSAGWMYLRLVRTCSHQRLMGSHRTRQ